MIGVGTGAKYATSHYQGDWLTLAITFGFCIIACIILYCFYWEDIKYFFIGDDQNDKN